MKDLIEQSLLASAETLRQTAMLLTEDISQAATLIIEALRAGGKVAFCGNGGAASDAQHLAGEFVGRFKRERRGLPGLAFTADSAILTAIGNDYGFDRVFERQVEAWLRPGDILVAISTSGKATNVLRAAQRARELGVQVIGLTGASGGELAEHVDLCLRVPSDDTPRIQEAHITLGHILCDLVDEAFTQAGCSSW